MSNASTDALAYAWAAASAAVALSKDWPSVMGRVLLTAC